MSQQKSPAHKQPASEEHGHVAVFSSSPPGQQPATVSKEGSPKSSNQFPSADPTSRTAISQSIQTDASSASRSKPPTLPGKRGLRSLAAKISRLVGEGRSGAPISKSETAASVAKLTQRPPLSVETPLSPAITAKFDVDEIEILRKIYRELNVRSLNDGIDKETFIQYFHLPGLWSERLFLMFDRKQSGHVDYEDLMRGLAVCCRGTKSERVRVLFDIVDINGDEKVSKEELTLLLSNLPNVETYVRTKCPLSSAAVSRTNSKGSLKPSPFCRTVLSSTELRSNTTSFGTAPNEKAVDSAEADDSMGGRRQQVPPPPQPLNGTPDCDSGSGFLESSFIDDQPGQGGTTLPPESLSADMIQGTNPSPPERLDIPIDDDGDDDDASDGSDGEEGNDQDPSRSSSSSLESHVPSGYWFRDGDIRSQHPERYCSTTSWRSSVSGDSRNENTDGRSVDEDQYLIGAGPSPMVAELLAKAAVDNDNENLTDVETLVASIIETYDAAASDALNFDDFKSFVEHHPRFLKLLSDCAREEVWSLQGHVLSRMPKQGKAPSSRSSHARFKGTMHNFGLSGGNFNQDDGIVDANCDLQVTEMLRMEKWIKIQSLFTNKAAPKQLSSQPAVTVKPFVDDSNSASAPNSAGSMPGVKSSGSPVENSNIAEDGCPPPQTSITSADTGGRPSLEVYPRHAKYAASREVVEFLESSLGQVASEDEESDTAGAVTSAVSKVTAAVDTVVHDRETLWQEKADALTCPNCLAPLLVCPKCDRRFPSLRMRSDNELTVECLKCVDGQPFEFTACWICQWPFLNAIEMIEKHQATLEGALWKMGKKSKEYVKRHFVLVDKLLYYYLAPEDTIPKGFIFLEGCFVDSISNEDAEDTVKQRLARETANVKSEMRQSNEPPSPIVSNVGPREEGNNLIGPSSAIAASDNELPEAPRYGFCIFHAGGTYGRRELYASDEQMRDKWMAALRGTLSQQAIDQLYSLKETIGHGKFSKVFRATEKTTGKDYAIKMISKVRMTAHEKELLRGEMSILRLLRHPHVIYLKSLVTTREVLHIVMEYVPGGELFDIITKMGHLSELVVNRLTGQLLKTLVYLHKAGIVHRDLKPENVLLSSKNVDEADIKIADFGLSCLCGPTEKLYQPCGTLVYVAPEVLTLQGYNHQVDLWSLGVMVYLLLCGKLPFPIVRNSGLSLITDKEKFYQPRFDSPVWKGISKSAQDFVCKLLQVDPEKRMSGTDALNHIWIKNPAAVLEGSTSTTSTSQNKPAVTPT